MTDKRVEAAAAAMRNIEKSNWAAAEYYAEVALGAADAADTEHVRVPREAALDLYRLGGFLAEYEVYKGLKEPVQELGKALFDVKA
jgi:hypothetical protein